MSQSQWLTSVIPATQEAKIGRITVGGQPGKKVGKIPSQQKSWMYWHMPIIPATGDVSKRIMVQTGLGKNTKPYLKKNYSRKGWECD
jgi:hypothetical protein